MRWIIHITVYLVTSTLAVLVGTLFRQNIEVWATREGYSTIIRDGWRSVVDAGFDQLVLGALVFFSGATVAFIIDDWFRRKEKAGATDARCHLLWDAATNEMRFISKFVNLSYCFCQPLFADFSDVFVGMIFECPVKKPHLFAFSTEGGVTLRELFSSERFMFLQIKGMKKGNGILVCVIAEHARAPSVRRQMPFLWDKAEVSAGISEEFAAWIDLYWNYRARMRLKKALFCLRQWLPGTSRRTPP